MPAKETAGAGAGAGPQQAVREVGSSEPAHGNGEVQPRQEDRWDAVGNT